MDLTKNRFPLLLLGNVFCLTGCSNPEKNGPLFSTDDQTRLSNLEENLFSAKYDDVIKDGQSYVADYPMSHQAWTILGWAYLKSNWLDNAEECLDKALVLDPRWDNAYVAKGVLHRKRGDLEMAIDSYLKAIDLVPDNAEAFASLLVIEIQLGNFQNAVENGEKAWALRKDNPTIPANLAVALHYVGNLEKRDEFYEVARKLGYQNLQKIKDIFDGKITLQ